MSEGPNFGIAVQPHFTRPNPVFVNTIRKPVPHPEADRATAAVDPTQLRRLVHQTTRRANRDATAVPVVELHDETATTQFQPLVKPGSREVAGMITQRGTAPEISAATTAAIRIEKRRQHDSVVVDRSALMPASMQGIEALKRVPESSAMHHVTQEVQTSAIETILILQPTAAQRTKRGFLRAFVASFATMLAVLIIALLVGCGDNLHPASDDSNDTVTILDGQTPVTPDAADPLMGVELRTANIDTNVGLEVALRVIAYHPDGSSEDVSDRATWTIANTGIATIDDAHTLHGVTAGRTEGEVALLGHSDHFMVTVDDAVIDQVTVSPARVSIPSGYDTQLSATGHYTDGRTVDVTDSALWSADGVHATVVGGHVTGHAAGSSVVSAAVGGKHGDAQVDVTAATCAALRVTANQVSLAVGRTLALHAVATMTDGAAVDVTTQAIWHSNLTALATVDSDGVVHGKAAGTVEISAATCGLTASASIDVTGATMVGLEVSPVIAVLPSGTKLQLHATALFSDGTARDVTTESDWQTDAPARATVASGLVSGFATGHVQISATTGGQTATAQLDVTNAVLVALSASAPSPTLQVGSSQQLAAQGEFSDGTTRDVTSSVAWFSESPLHVGVSLSGMATAVTPGPATIDATFGGLTASVTVTATAATLMHIDVTPATLRMPIAGIAVVLATASYSDGTTRDVTAACTWTSSDPTVATVADGPLLHGVVTAQAAGSAMVTASLGGQSAATSVEVTPATATALAIFPLVEIEPVGVTVGFMASALYSDGTVRDVTSEVVWASALPTVASISNAPGFSGVATTIGVGVDVISAKFGALTAVATLTVTPAVLVSLDVAPAAVSLALGTATDVVATGHFSDGTTHDLSAAVTWTASSPLVATVLAGHIIGTSVGSTVLTAHAGELTADVAVTVSNATLTGLAVSPATATVPAGRTVDFTALGAFSDQSFTDMTAAVLWTSSNPLVATISNAAGTQGRVTGLLTGTATITATRGLISATATVTVTSATVVSLVIAPTTTSVAAGRTATVTATATFTDGSSLDVTALAWWTAAQPATATVALGVVSGRAQGTTAITAAFDNVTATASVTVTAPVAVALVVTPLVSIVPAGTTAQLAATATFSDGTTRDVTAQTTFTSATLLAATVDTSGLVQTLAVGTSVITGTYAGLTAIANVTVLPAALVGLTVTPATLTVAAGQTGDLVATGHYSDGSSRTVTAEVLWSSNAPLTASVIAGHVIGITAGTTYVTAAVGSITATSIITVGAANLTALTLAPATPVIPLLQSVDLAAIGTYTDGTTAALGEQCLWTSSNPLVASVSNLPTTKGRVQGLLAGTATITASCGNLSASTTATVNAAVVTALTVTGTATALPLGTTAQLAAIAQFSDGSSVDVTGQATWTVTGTSATVSNAQGTRGKVTAAALGAGTVVATFGSTVGQTTTSTVAAALASLALQAPGTALSLWQVGQLRATATFTDGSSADVTEQAAWTSSAPLIASLSTTSGTRGRIVGRAAGSATSAATFGGLTATGGVTVGTGSCHIVINEVKTGSLLLTRDEFIELYNPCEYTVDLSQARLVYRVVLGLVDISLGDLSGTLAGGAFKVYGGTSYVGLSDGAITTDLAGLGGGIALRDIPSGGAVDSMGYGATLGSLVEGAVSLILPTGSSLARVPNGQDTNNNGVDFVVRGTPTPGAVNF